MKRKATTTTPDPELSMPLDMGAEPDRPKQDERKQSARSASARPDAAGKRQTRPANRESPQGEQP